MKVNVLILLVIVVLSLASCKCKKTKSQSQSQSPYWQQTDYKVDNNTFTGKYLTYKLNEKAFLDAFSRDTVLIPDLQGNLKLFFVEPVQTMSPELAAKFPEIKTFKGYQIDNRLCQSRITFSNLKADITVLCNDMTYMVRQVNQNNTTFYVVFDQKDTQNTLRE